jgi:alpha-glucuronidase
VGFDRKTGGTGVLNQYREPYASIYNNIDSCPEELLLWFHHVPWTHKMKSGRNLWEELCFKYNAGVTMVDRYVDEWSLVKNYVDRQRWNEVNDRLLHQQMNAREWRDTCLKYFQKFSHQSLPE